MGRSVLVIANPAAGFRSVDPGAEAAVRRLSALGFRPELFRTQGPGDAERAAREGAGGFDVVVAAGGDGTVHEVANGLARSETPMGIVPLGSMNILARELGIPLDARRASEWLGRAEPGAITLGLRGERFFVLMAGIGYDAFALERAIERSSRAGRKVRFSDYAFEATLGARRYAFPTIVAESDGFTGTGAFALVANCPRYGANFRIADRARLDEPLLDLVLYEKGGFWPRLNYFLFMLAGLPARPKGVIYRKLEAVVIRAQGEDRVPCQLDGEISEPLPARISAVPGALLLLRSPAARVTM